MQDTPKFCELSIITKDSVKIFNYCVKNRFNDTIATATGFSKKEAENNVSKEALLYYGLSIS
jgi:dsRNA-specific ribonuclease